MTQDPKAKLTDIEIRMRRWHTRLTRASNMLQKLEKQRRRLVGIVAYVTPAPGREKPPSAMAAAMKAIDEVLPPKPAEDDKIPDFLNRADPLIAEKMTVARKKAEEEARHKMPLSGRDAMQAIMAVPVTPKRKRKA